MKTMKTIESLLNELKWNQADYDVVKYHIIKIENIYCNFKDRSKLSKVSEQRQMELFESVWVESYQPYNINNYKFWTDKMDMKELKKILRNNKRIVKGLTEYHRRLLILEYQLFNLIGENEFDLIK